MGFGATTTYADESGGDGDAHASTPASIESPSPRAESRKRVRMVSSLRDVGEQPTCHDNAASDHLPARASAGKNGARTILAAGAAKPRERIASATRWIPPGPR
jgi:hypothetical protein